MLKLRVEQSNVTISMLLYNMAPEKSEERGQCGQVWQNFDNRVSILAHVFLGLFTNWRNVKILSTFFNDLRQIPGL